MSVMARVEQALSFVAAYYPNLKRAKEMLALLKRTQKEGDVKILDAAIIRNDRKSGKRWSHGV